MNTAAERWRPAPLLKASGAVHLAAAACVLARPAWWPWGLAAVLANHVQLTALGLWPRSAALGCNWTRLPPRASARGQIALTIDDGPDPKVTPGVLELLAAHAVPATFFCIGERVERHPDLARAIVRAGHGIENHTQRHRAFFPCYGPGQLRREIGGCQRSIERVTGARPRFFRAPAGLRSPLLDAVLHGMGLTLASWTRRGFDTVSGEGERVLARLARGLAAGDILTLHDGHAARTQGGEPVLLQVLPPLLAAVRAAGLHPVTLQQAAA